MVKHTQTIRRLLATNCLSVFDHFVWLALKGLKSTNVTFSLDISNVKIGLGMKQCEISSDCISQHLLSNFIMEFRVVVFQDKLS